jgi:RNA polymerase sigma-70 factor (ECF subfamily)
LLGFSEHALRIDLEGHLLTPCVKYLHSIPFPLRIYLQKGNALSLEPDVRMEEALREAIRGDHGAFAEIVREHQAMVFSIGWYFLADKSLAEDLAQEVFLECYRGLADIHSSAHLTNWLRRVAIHRSIDQGRRKKVRREVTFDETPEPAREDAQADSFLAERLHQIVAKLPEKQRAVVLLRYQEDLEPAEIAALLEISVNTVKSLLQRALDELRGKLGRKLKETRYAIF